MFSVGGERQSGMGLKKVKKVLRWVEKVTEEEAERGADRETNEAAVEVVEDDVAPWGSF